MIGRRVRVAGLTGTIRARHSLTVRPCWVVVLDDKRVLLVRSDEWELV